MITYIFHIFLLFLSAQMQNFPPLLKSWARQLWKSIAGENPEELHQWLHMFDTSPIQVFHQPVFYCCFKKLFC